MLHPKQVTSTGEVSTPTEPIVTEQTPGRSESTDEVPFDAEPIVSRAEHHGQGSTGEVETPGPTTTRTEWLDAAEVKVVTPPAPAKPRAATQAETKGGGVRGPARDR